MLGIGRRECGDDAAGPLVLAHLRRHGVRAELRTCDGGSGELLDAWRGRRAVVIVDALRSGAPTGTLRRIDLRRAAPPAGQDASTHGFGLAFAFQLAATLGKLPRVLIAHGVEGARFWPGDELSPQVRAALPQLVARVAREVARLTPSHRAALSR